MSCFIYWPCQKATTCKAETDPQIDSNLAPILVKGQPEGSVCAKPWQLGIGIEDERIWAGLNRVA